MKVPLKSRLNNGVTRDHPCITLQEKGGGEGGQKMYFLITFSTESNHKEKGRRGSKNLRS